MNISVKINTNNDIKNIGSCYIYDTRSHIVYTRSQKIQQSLYVEICVHHPGPWGN